MKWRRIATRKILTDRSLHYSTRQAVMDQRPPRKKVKIDNVQDDARLLRIRRAAFLDSLAKPVSPPPSRSPAFGDGKQKPQVVDSTAKSTPSVQKRSSQAKQNVTELPDRQPRTANKSAVTSMSSPIQLTSIRDLPASENVDTVSLHDILGDPLIKEAWIFNFCFDIDWVMQHFDSDVRDMVKVNIVHGSWRREDVNKICIDDACSRWANAHAIQAYLPDAFGTHHSKMFILFRHDDHAQVVIHTANMIPQDWTNMTQAVWRSPLLPSQLTGSQATQDVSDPGHQFKHDLLRYVKAYGSKLKPLAHQLQSYDFTGVKAALVASVPSKFKLSCMDDEVWGHEMLRRKLALYQSKLNKSAPEPHFVFQISSIASLTPTWFDQTLHKACGSTPRTTSIIFPTAPDVAQSLDGYVAGGSIHTKAQKPIHLKQIDNLRPQLCRWTRGTESHAQAGRHLAAPHIKTYLRFTAKPTKENPTPAIDWALVTSANLSTQAWGSAAKLAKGEKNPQDAVVHIQSFEIGVLVMPEMFDKAAGIDDPVEMVPCFKKDTLYEGKNRNVPMLALRMPYDLPLTSYAAGELPWSSQSAYNTPDRHGRLWQH